MKVLYIVGSCLYNNTSANMSHNAYVQGLLENGCDVDIIMPDSSFGEKDANLKKLEKATYYEYSSTSSIEKLKDRFKKSFDKDIVGQNEQSQSIYLSESETNEEKKTLKMKVRQVIKNIYNKIFIGENLYYLQKEWLKQASKFKSDIEYDIVISNSSPAASHKLAQILLEKKNVQAKRWIQIWEDPWYYDIYGNHNENILNEENKLLQATDEIYYVSPLTLMYQGEYFKEYADKMKFIPLPYFETESETSDTSGEISFGYFGDYYSHTRNLQPFYDALLETKAYGYIYGDTNLNLKQTDKIEISGRVTLDVLNKVQKNTNVLVNLCNLRGGQIPGKIYHYSATKKPIIFILDGTEKEKIQIKKYFEQYKRYYFCENNFDDICRVMKLFVNKEVALEENILLDFSPKNIIKKLL
ncbi:hypothetical protein [Intestinibacter sp.]